MSDQNMNIELLHGAGDLNSNDDITHAIIWLHGLGASSSDFPPVVPELDLSNAVAIRFIFPQAPNRPITINGGMTMPGWYDIKGSDIADKQDAEGMAASQAMLEKLIQAEIDKGVPSENIIIAGFSQGGAVAYHTAVRSEHRLGGVLALSTYLPFAEQVAEEQSGANKQTPILAMHGSQDPVVSLALGKQSAETLVELDYSVEWREYPMQHQVVIEQIKHIGHWINQVFSKT